ncbi:MarR family transcriptional regulator [Neobacillus cucumis]|uniref:MarR family winged helix-turn-helix transcriptional regulator n=1 Tax=Neobacillus cucumis TaxID=1740721 RepID=UPI00203F9DB6|nr:MarR family transcriptional regulator [Neobacillus cucumis]MCM3729863.1 MarR family transcriptional regulator [Neobacillus cucumis]
MNPFDKYISTLLNQANTKIHTAVKNKIAPYQLAPEQSLILFVLRLEDGLTQKEIGELLGKDKANIARMAANLEEKGFIRREQDPESRRNLKLYLTPTGSKVYEEAYSVFEEYDALISNRLTPEELKQLKILLLKLMDF